MVHNLFHFPQNAIYFIILSSSVQAILMIFINHALKFKYRPGCLKVNLCNTTCPPFRTVNFEVRSKQTTVTQKCEITVHVILSHFSKKK